MLLVYLVGVFLIWIGVLVGLVYLGVGSMVLILLVWIVCSVFVIFLLFLGIGRL